MQTSEKDISNPSDSELLLIQNIRLEPLNEKYLQDWVMGRVKKNNDDKDEINFRYSFKSCKNKKKMKKHAMHMAWLMDNEDYDEIKFQNSFKNCKNKEKIKEQYAMDMVRMGRLFRRQKHFRKICEDIHNKFVTSSFTTYIANNCEHMENYNDSVNKWHDKPNDLKYIIDLFGSKLTCLSLERYQYSHIMPFINNNCPNLEQLQLRFQEIKSEDFENVFSNMSNLKGLRITWACDNSTLPDTLVNSLEQVGGTLKYLYFNSYFSRNIFLPDSLALVFPQLIALKELCVAKFGLRQPLLQSIGEMKNLVKFYFNPGSRVSNALDTHPVFADKNINMYPIGNLKTLKFLHIESDCGVTDEFLINLCNNSEKLREIHIIGTNLTDDGMIALNNLKQLKYFYLRSIDILVDNKLSTKNEFITDASIQYLYNKKLKTLMLLDCINVTNRSVIKLVENLPNLKHLFISNTSVTCEVVEEISGSTKYRKKPLYIYVSFKDSAGAFKRLSQSANIRFFGSRD